MSYFDIVTVRAHDFLTDRTIPFSLFSSLSLSLSLSLSSSIYTALRVVKVISGQIEFINFTYRLSIRLTDFLVTVISRTALPRTLNPTLASTGSSRDVLISIGPSQFLQVSVRRGSSVASDPHEVIPAENRGSYGTKLSFADCRLHCPAASVTGRGPYHAER